MIRKFWMALILVLLNLALLESVSFVIANWFIPQRLIFNPQLTDGEIARFPSLYEIYLRARDPNTGWPAIKEAYVDPEDINGTYFQYDSLNSRISAAFPDTDQHICVSLFGDSFTFSSEVSKEFAWSNVLAKKLNCRVNNFGIGGYGSDQAYLRYKHMPDDAPVVFLNHLSENIIRNSTQMRALIVGYRKAKNNPLSYKPKFIIDGTGNLQLIKLPTFKSSEYIDVLYYPGKYLKYDYFLPDGDSGLIRPSFPYTLTLLKLVNHYHVNAKLKGIPWFMPFYEPDHLSNGLEVTGRVMLEFEKLAKQRGQLPVLTVIPTGLDLMYYRNHKVWPYQNLIDFIKESGSEVINFGPGINARLGDTDPCTLFDTCKAHYNEQGYEYLGEIAYEIMQSRKLLPE
jgi:hypothetical protein